MLPVHDLRRVLMVARASRPAGEEGEGFLSPGTPSSPAEDEEGDDEHSEPDASESKQVRNQRLKSLSDECAKHRNNAKTEKERADAAEITLAESTSTINELRKHNAFLIAAAGKV